jgi:hypothetical protein
LAAGLVAPSWNSQPSTSSLNREVGQIVHPWCLDLHRAGPGRDHPRLGVPVAHHQPPATLITLTGVHFDVGGHLGLQRGGQHAAGALAHDLVQHRRHVLARRLIGHYSQHRRSFLAGVPAPANLVLVQRGRYVAPSIGWPIHKFRSYLVVSIALFLVR